MRYASATAKHQMNERADSYATARIVFASGHAVDLGKDDFWLENSYIESSESSSFPIGTLIAKSVTLSLVNDDERWEGYAFYGCQIFLYSNFDLDDGTTFTIFLGTFSVITPERYGQAIEISGVDDSYKTDREYTTNITFPTTARSVFLDAAQTCQISTAVSAFTNDTYTITEKPSGTFRQIFGELAALAGGNAKFDNYNRLNIVPYSLDVFTEGNLYGGIFDPATPYATGDTADGGIYNPWNTGDVFNSGTFAELNALFDQYKTHYLPSWLDLTVEADDVVITGVQIERNGTIYRNSVNTNYIITLNPSISTGNEQAYVQLVGGEVIGFRFRPFSGEYISYPLAEAMDLAIIVDRRGRAYNTVLTEVVYNFSGSTSFKCDADAPIRNQARYSSEATKEIVELRNQTVKQINTAEQSAKTYSDGQLNAFKNGDYATFVTNTTNAINSKITTYYQSDAPIIHTTGDLWIDTDDDNKLYRWNGVGWVSVRDAGIADALVAAGDAQSTADRKIVTFAQDSTPTATDTGDLWIDTNDFNKLYRWSGTTWVAVSDSSALNTFIAGTYATDKSALESQIDEKIETWYQTSDPASSWTTSTEKAKHVGDLWYCSASTGTYAGKYWQYTYESSAYSWKELKATPPAGVMNEIDGKSTIYTGSTTPSAAEEGDLWFKGTTEPILTYVNGSWVAYNKYTDDSTFNSWITNTYADDKSALEAQIDGKIETWYQSTNPASSWSDNTTKAKHVGDLWYCTASSGTYAGKYWQYTYASSAYSWKELKATPPVGVMDEIDGKANIFTGSTTPTGAAEGDLWFKGTSEPILTYVNGSWVAYNKYTDDSTFNSWITSTYTSDKSALESQIDGKAETWYQSTNPASSWSAAEKPNHKGDIWYCTATSGTYAGKNWMYSGSDWEEFTAEVPQSVYDMIDGKASIFVGSTTPSSPQAGDLWFKGTNQPILTYVNGSWVTYNKYTDDSTFTTFQNGQYATDQAALRSLVSTENSATKAFANTLSTLIAQGMGLFFTEEVQQDESVIYYMHDKQTLALSTNIWRISGNSWSVSTDGGTTWNAAIDAQGNILVNTLSAVGISFSWARGGILTLGGMNDGRGLLDVYDENGYQAGRWSSGGLWSRTSISTAESGALNTPNVYLSGASERFRVEDRTLSRVYMVDRFDQTNNTYYGHLVIEGQEGIYLNGQVGTDYVPFIIINPTNTINGFDEDILLKNSIFFGQPDDPNSNTTALVQLGKFTQIQWGLRPQDSVYRSLAWVKFSATGNTNHEVNFHCNRVNIGASDWSTTLNVYGTKNRAVVTKNYGIVGMSAFESANALFSDVGSGTVGEDGTVTIVFDPIFAETIEMNMEYQVLITRTSAKETEWVDKQHGMFIVHGEAGATFDWMVIARQIEYGLHRTPQIEPEDDNNDGIPIVPEDNSALAAVEEMVQQFEEGADIL